eukprot:m.118920 g.118920  ORF g.118920 m.118920 type:complete len:72 (+) comp10999_c0_seq2:1763-1978(+)
MWRHVAVEDLKFVVERWMAMYLQRREAMVHGLSVHGPVGMHVREYVCACVRVCTYVCMCGVCTPTMACYLV